MSKFGGVPIEETTLSKFGGIPVEIKEEPSQEKSTSELLQGVPTPESEKERSTWSYVVDQMKKRYGDYADLLVRGGLNTAYDPRVWESLPPEAKAAVQERVSQDRSAELAPFGYQGLEPRTETEKWMGVAGAASVDPLTVIPTARVFTGGKYLLNTAKPYALAALEWSTGTAAETAGAAGAEAARRSFEGTDYEDSVMDHLFRFGSSIAAGTLPGAGVSVFKSGREGYRAGANVARENAGTVSDVLANANVKAVLDSAIQSQGDTFGERLRAAEELQKQFPELVLPLVDVVGENAILAKEFRKLYSSDPVFRQKYDDAARLVQQQFTKFEQGIFPSPLKPGEQIRNPVLEEANKKAIAARAKANEKLTNIETVRGKLAERYDEAPLSTNVEKAARNVAESAEKAAREVSSKYYDDAFALANEKGITVPPATVQGIWSFSGAQRKSDLFAEFPTLYRKIQQNWSPREIEVPGGVSGRTSLEFPEVSVQELDSLKRELNKAIRSTDDRTKQAALGDLKDELDAQIRSINPEFAAAYKLADTKYYEGVGLPTSLNGYRSIDSARFSTTVSEALTKPDQIRDYLNFVGKDAGLEVVRDAMLLKARRSILNNSGDVDPNKLRAFMARNRDALNEVPEVRALFEKDALLADRINRGKAKVDSNYNTYALEQSEGFFKALTDKNLGAISSEVINNPGKRAQYLQQIDTLSPENKKLALTGLRQSVLDKAFKSNTTAVEYINNNKAAFNELFGPEYTDQINNLARLRDIIDTNKDNLVASAISHRQSTAYKEVSGLSVEETVGTLRNQVMSPQRKFLHLFFKAAMTKSSAKADKAMADVLLDTNAIAELNKEATRLREALDQQGNYKLVGKAFWDFSKKFSSTLGGYITLGGARGAVGGFMNDDLANEASMLPTLEEDDWLFAPQ